MRLGRRKRGTRRRLRARAIFVLALALAIALSPRPGGGAAAQEPTPTPDLDATAARVVASMTIDERVGQLVMVNFVGDDVSAQSDIAGLIRDFRVGAVIVTASNGNVVNRGDTPRQLAALTNGLQQRAYEASRRADGSGEYFLPLLIATDNEGDLFPFSNITNGYSPLPDNMTVGATWSKQHAYDVGHAQGSELGAAGINMLLGPVADVLASPRSGGSGDIGTRAFGGDATWVGELARAYIRGVHEGSAGRMLTVAKHFPGHGGSDRSTDNEVPTVNKSLDQLRALELAPFAEVDRSDGADPLGTTDAMMVSHIRYRNFVAGGAEPFTRPISLDAPAFATLMALPEFAAWRNDHLVMSDSLGVPAVKKWYAQQEGQPDFPNRTVVRDALMAGSDLLPLIEFYADPAHPGWKDNQLPMIQDSILYMREQYSEDPDFRRRVDDAVRHVVAEKVRLYPSLRLADVLVDPDRAAAAAGQATDAMRALSDDALTLIQPASVAELRARLPRGPLSPEHVLIAECWADCYPYRIKTASSLQDELLRLYGPDGEGRLKPGDVSTISFGALDAWLSQPDAPENAAVAKQVADAAWIIFAIADYNPNQYPASGAVKRFLDSAPVDVRNKSLVAIAYTVPYHLDSTEISKLAAYFAVYGKTEPAIDSGFRALFGDVTPRGHSPVDVSGIFYSVADAVQPDPDQDLRVSVFGQSTGNVPADAGKVGLVAGPVLDRNGNPVPDGTTVRFTLTGSGTTVVTANAATVDGIAGAQLPLAGRGSYTATASVGALVSHPLAVEAGPRGAPEPQTATSADGGGRSLLPIAVGVPSAVLALGALAAAAFVWRRRTSGAPAGGVPAAPALATAGVPAHAVESAVPSPEHVVPAEPPRLRVDLESRRVYVHGVEARPGLSNEQFRLLSYLYERSGKVVGREELIAHVWPDAHAEGVSEEALDALVRRVRERLVQAGGERGYITTLRGQGFRLEV